MKISALLTITALVAAASALPAPFNSFDNLQTREVEVADSKRNVNPAVLGYKRNVKPAVLGYKRDEEIEEAAREVNTIAPEDDPEIGEDFTVLAYCAG